MTKSLIVDPLDVRLVQALQLDGRASFSSIAEVLDVSPHTVARRFRRLRSSAGLRILGRFGAGEGERPRWTVRLRCAPDTAQEVAGALARRADTSFIVLVQGGAELVCFIDSEDDKTAESLLLRQLPRTSSIVAVDAHRLLHTFYGGPDGWFAKIDAMTAEQISALRPIARTRVSAPKPDSIDRALVAELSRDGRAGHPRLGAVTRLSEPSVRRRLTRLCDTGTLYFDIQLDPGLLGYHMIALLWLSTTPAALESVGAELAVHPEVAFAAATTGPSNLVAAVICPSAEALYTYLTHRIATLDGIQRIETAPVVRQVKQLTTG
ncbi:AsnC family transcriptional regulator [Nocardia sp. NBC_01377]|uniref:Lrp/AsnC family transcriptional regulator n=1 Tax=Nocardia sp. NBC_01377 TaxID=2903595 RepID=UPI00324A1FC3